MDTPITRAEHEEFRRRIEEENKRQDKRLELLEQNTKQIGSLTVSVEKLAISIESMVKEQEQQGQRLDKLEDAPAEKWKIVGKTILTSVISAVSGGIVVGIVAMLAQYIK